MTRLKRWRERLSVSQSRLELQIGMPVKISSPENFKGYKLAWFEQYCKKDGGYTVRMFGTYEKVCIVPDRGDTIISVLKET